MQLGSTEWNRLIADGANELNLTLDQKKIERLGRHAAELLRWNQTINLTAITDPAKIAVNHFLDSLAPAPLIPPNASLLDIGSGGGFPGIPLKVLTPSLSVMLIDASRKKISFLKHAIRTLDLHNIEARQIRAEDLIKDGTPTHIFDVIISRALSSTDVFVHKALPLLSKNGIIILMKGKLAQKDFESMRASMQKIQPKPLLTVKHYRLPHLHAERSLLLVKRNWISPESLRQI